LTALHGHEVITQWKELVDQGRRQDVVEALLTQHYDLAYRRSIAANFPHLKDALVLRPTALGDEDLRTMAASSMIGML